MKTPVSGTMEPNILESYTYQVPPSFSRWNLQPGGSSGSTQFHPPWNLVNTHIINELIIVVPFFLVCNGRSERAPISGCVYYDLRGFLRLNFKTILLILNHFQAKNVQMFRELGGRQGETLVPPQVELILLARAGRLDWKLATRGEPSGRRALPRGDHRERFRL